MIAIAHIIFILLHSSTSHSLALAQDDDFLAKPSALLLCS